MYVCMYVYIFHNLCSNAKVLQRINCENTVSQMCTRVLIFVA